MTDNDKQLEQAARTTVDRELDEFIEQTRDMTWSEISRRWIAVVHKTPAALVTLSALMAVAIKRLQAHADRHAGEETRVE